MINFGAVTAVRENSVTGYVEAQVKSALEKTEWLTVLTWDYYVWSPVVGDIVAFAYENNGVGVVFGKPLTGVYADSTKNIARKGDTVSVTVTGGSSAGTYAGTITSGSLKANLTS